MRVRISTDSILRHESQQRKGVPKWVYLLTIKELKCAITVDFTNEEDPYFLYIDDVPFESCGLKPGTLGSPRARSSSLIPSDIAKTLPSTSKWALREGDIDPAQSGANSVIASPNRNERAESDDSMDGDVPGEAESAPVESQPKLKSSRSRGESEGLPPSESVAHNRVHSVSDDYALSMPVPGDESESSRRRSQIRRKASQKDVKVESTKEIRVGSGSIDISKISTTATVNLDPFAPPIPNPFNLVVSPRESTLPPAPCNSPMRMHGTNRFNDPFAFVASDASGYYGGAMSFDNPTPPFNTPNLLGRSPSTSSVGSGPSKSFSLGDPFQSINPFESLGAVAKQVPVAAFASPPSVLQRSNWAGDAPSGDSVSRPWASSEATECLTPRVGATPPATPYGSHPSNSHIDSSASNLRNMSINSNPWGF